VKRQGLNISKVTMQESLGEAINSELQPSVGLGRGYSGRVPYVVGPLHQWVKEFDARFRVSRSTKN
jgi:hypothetical protein